MRDQWSGLLIINFQTRLDRLWFIIISLNQHLTAPITAATDLRCGKGQVKNTLAFLATASPTQAFDDVATRHTKINDSIKSKPAFLEHCVQFFCLRDRSWKPIKNKTVVTRRITEPRAYHINDNRIRYKLARIHAFFRFEPQGRLVPDGLSQEVASRNFRPTKLRGYPISLSTFSNPGSPEKHESHQFALGRSTTQPSLLEEAVVIAVQEMGLNLLSCIQPHTNDNQEGGSAKVKRHIQLINQKFRNHTDDG